MCLFGPTREEEGEGVTPPLYLHGNPSQVILRLLLAPEISGGCRNSQSCDTAWRTQAALPSLLSSTKTSTPKTRVATLSAERLGTMSNNLREREKGSYRLTL